MSRFSGTTYRQLYYGSTRQVRVSPSFCAPYGAKTRLRTVGHEPTRHPAVLERDDL